jgi:hypothetical protein
MPCSADGGTNSNYIVTTTTSDRRPAGHCRHIRLDNPQIVAAHRGEVTHNRMLQTCDSRTTSKQIISMLLSKCWMPAH